jgi:hypothetical protein
MAPCCEVMKAEVGLDVCGNGRVHDKTDSFGDYYTANEEYMNRENDRHRAEEEDMMECEKILKIVVCGYRGIYCENGVSIECYTEKEAIDCIKASGIIVRGYKERREERGEGRENKIREDGMQKRILGNCVRTSGEMV